MCGFAGFWQQPGWPKEQLLDTALEMAGALQHRGPDDAGSWCDADVGLGFGFRRLSVIDVSAEGRQPMVSSCGRFVIAYNGEVYNFPDLRRDLEAQGQQFRGHSDTEVILAAIARWGLEQALKRFVGMFAFALWDRQDHRLKLVRDRFGIKPLYWGISDGVLLFGSALRGLRPHPAFRGRIDRDILTLYLRHNYIPDPHCIYHGFQKLSPGYLAVFQGPREPEIRCWWSARKVAVAGNSSPLQVSDGDALEQLDHIARQAVSQRMVADVPLGAFLSGGIDSSLVVSLMQAQSNRPVKTFTIGFHEKDHNEAVFARRVAEHLNTDHTELYLHHREAMEVIPGLPEYWDEPFGDSSQIPTYMVSRMARAEVTVCLSGDGGDELFGGYNHHRDRLRHDRKAHLIPRILRRPVAAGLRLLQPEGWPRVQRMWDRTRAGPVLLNRRLRQLIARLEVDPGQELYQMVLSQHRQPASLMYRHDEPTTLLRDPSLQADLPGLHERMMYLDTVTYLTGDILTKLDRASMAVSLEARVPLLDHRLYEFAWRLPLRQRVGPGQGKKMLRALLRRYVPPALFERPKQGFSIPVGDWLRGPLRSWADELLQEERLRREGFFDPRTIRQLWIRLQNGHREHVGCLWGVLSFQMWLARWHAELAG